LEPAAIAVRLQRIHQMRAKCARPNGAAVGVSHVLQKKSAHTHGLSLCADCAVVGGDQRWACALMRREGAKLLMQAACCRSHWRRVCYAPIKGEPSTAPRAA
jgi:hypothetical protein